LYTTALRKTFRFSLLDADVLLSCAKLELNTETARFYLERDTLIHRVLEKYKRVIAEPKTKIKRTRTYYEKLSEALFPAFEV
jgi:hypothetical protein